VLILCMGKLPILLHKVLNLSIQVALLRCTTLVGAFMVEVPQQEPWHPFSYVWIQKQGLSKMNVLKCKIMKGGYVCLGFQPISVIMKIPINWTNFECLVQV
jgi:hypothetical protein